MEAGQRSFDRSGGVATDAVADNQIQLDLVLYGFVQDFSRVLDHLRSQQARNFFLEEDAFYSGF